MGRAIADVSKGATIVTPEEKFIIHLIELERFNFPSGVPTDFIIAKGKEHGFSQATIREAIKINSLLQKNGQEKVIDY